MGNINSSGMTERFTLASGESKVFSNKANELGVSGGNLVVVDAHGDEDQDLNGAPLATGSAVVKLQTSEDNVTYTDVATATVVSRGYASVTGSVGAYFKILNNGPAQAHFVAKPQRVCQVVGAL